MTGARFAAALVATLSAAARAWAADGTPNAAAEGKLFDFSVPDVPAFTALGVSPSRVSRPGTLVDLAAALANGMTPAGGVQSGLALEVAPVSLAGVKSALLAPLRLSAATDVVSSKDGTSTRVAGALRWAASGTDAGDDDFQFCLDRAVPQTEEPPEPPPPGASRIEKRLDKLEFRMDSAEARASRQVRNASAIGRCRAAFKAARLAKHSFELAGAVVGESLNDPRISALSTSQASVWLAMSYSLNSVAAPLRRALSKLRSDPGLGVDEALQDVDVAHAYGFEPLLFARLDAIRASGRKDLTVLARLPLVWDRFSVFAEGGLGIDDLRNREGSGTQVRWPIGLGADLRLTNSTWVGLSLSGDAADNSFFAVSNLKWAVGSDRPY